jgi:hypothetical protein
LRRLKHNHFSASPTLYSFALLGTCSQIYDETADYLSGERIHASVFGLSPQSTFERWKWRFEHRFFAKDYQIQGCCAWDMERHLNQCLQLNVGGLPQVVALFLFTDPRHTIQDMLQANYGLGLSDLFKAADTLRPVRFAISTLKSVPNVSYSCSE